MGEQGGKVNEGNEGKRIHIKRRGIAETISTMDAVSCSELGSPSSPQ